MMTSYMDFNETIITTIMYSNESTETTTSINESSLDDLCKNFHVSIFR
jgi:hypothetical protein